MDPWEIPSYADSPMASARQHERIGGTGAFDRIDATADLVTSKGGLRVTLKAPAGDAGNAWDLVAVEGNATGVVVDTDEGRVTLTLASGATAAAAKAALDADAATSAAYTGGEDGTGTFAAGMQAVAFRGGRDAGDRTLRRVSKGVRVEKAGSLVCRLVDDEQDLVINVTAGEPLDLRVAVVRQSSTAVIDAWS